MTVSLVVHALQASGKERKSMVFDWKEGGPGAEIRKETRGVASVLTAFFGLHS
jgi:hypothetical protein